MRSPATQEAFKLALSMTLFYWLTLWLDWEMPKYGALAIALMSVGTAGASIEKGVLRVVGTTIGLVVGMLALALFAQDRWLMLGCLAAYLVFVGYHLQSSRAPYAWFVAGFMPPLVWASTYGDVGHTFHYATFRYLETAAGVIVYSLVTAVLWPKRAGDALPKQGAEVWTALRSLFGAFRRRLEGGSSPDEPAADRARLEAAMVQMTATIRAAATDTAWVRDRTRAWNALQADVQAFDDAFSLWRESTDDCRRLPLEQLAPRLPVVLDAIEARLGRAAAHWDARFNVDGAAEPGEADATDAELLEPIELPVERAPGPTLSHFDRAAVLSFVQQVEAIEHASRRLLHAVRVVTGRAPLERLDARAPAPAPEQPPGVDRERLTRALLPALCLVVAWFFWIHFDPPTGPNIPNLASVFGLVCLMSPAPVIRLLPVMLGVICVAVAPVYFFVMPRLGTGVGVLSLIFGYTFLLGLVGARKPMLQVLSLALFVMLADIDNDQVYSFMALVSGGMMFVLSMTIVAVVQMLVSPPRPEQALLRSVRRFFRGGARFMGTFAGEKARGEAVRKHAYESLILPEMRHLRAIEAQLGRERDLETDAEHVQRLIGALQSVTLRLRAFELACDRLARRSLEWSDRWVALGGEFRRHVTDLLERWSRLEPVDRPPERSALERLGRDLSRHLDEALARPREDRIDDAALVDLYAMLGRARGLIRAVDETHGAASRIDWNRWAEARF